MGNDRFKTKCARCFVEYDTVDDRNGIFRLWATANVLKNGIEAIKGDLCGSCMRALVNFIEGKTNDYDDDPTVLALRRGNK